MACLLTMCEMFTVGIMVFQCVKAFSAGLPLPVSRHSRVHYHIRLYTVPFSIASINQSTHQYVYRAYSAEEWVFFLLPLGQPSISIGRATARCSPYTVYSRCDHLLYGVREGRDEQIGVWLGGGTGRECTKDAVDKNTRSAAYE